MGEESDELLVDRFRETGEMIHFDTLVRRHIGRVRALVYPMVLNHADTDDLTQEVFLRVAEHLARFRNEARFTTWLHRITVNTALGFLRRRERNPVTAQAEVPELADPAAGPGAAAALKEQDVRIAEALAGLSPVLRAAITLTAMEGLGVAEAARAQGCLTATMYWRIHQARKLLRASLEKDLRP